jgi:hypothetical protein
VSCIVLIIDFMQRKHGLFTACDLASMRFRKIVVRLDSGKAEVLAQAKPVRRERTNVR